MNNLLKAPKIIYVHMKWNHQWEVENGYCTTSSVKNEFCRQFFETFRKGFGIRLNPWPLRSSLKNGKLERNNGVFKKVLSRIEKEKTSAQATLLIERAYFITNQLHQNSDVIAFQLTSDYTPSIVGVTTYFMSQDIFYAHAESCENRELYCGIYYRKLNLTPENLLKNGTWISVY